MFVLMLMSILMSHASVDLFVLSLFYLVFMHAYVASENQALVKRFVQILSGRHGIT